MTRYSGSTLEVRVGGNSVTYATAWDMTIQDETASRFGVGATIPDIATVYHRKSGSFEAESDPADTVQAACVSAPTEGALVLYEHSGASHTVSNARITAGVSVTRGGKPIRRFTFVEIPS